MRVLIAPDSFKGSLSSHQVGELIRDVWISHFKGDDVMTVSVADGGEGTVEALEQSMGGRRVTCTVNDPLGRKIEADYVIIEDTATMEMASASGLSHLNRNEMDPLKTTTKGTGELILNALDKGIRKIAIGIGGSATNDCGLGMLEVLGAKFYQGDRLMRFKGAKNLSQITKIDFTGMDTRIGETEFVVMCDVANPLTGVSGATYVYGPQKGLDTGKLHEIDAAMTAVGRLLNAYAGFDACSREGSGAAGGLGAAFLAVLGAELKSGIDVVLDRMHFDDLLSDVDLVITGEGRIDDQTKHGKVAIGVSRRAKKLNIPVIAIGGSVTKEADELYEYGFSAIVSTVTEPTTLEDLIRDSKVNLISSVDRTCRLIEIGRHLKFERGCLR
ncbi:MULTISPECIES: glycerate kinase [unclassified Fusibacter]|uniref:glycerate kinase family protein n=1 Tax=unclassified Fusibacter TaxID=2624464 RepID=UPI0010102E2A|nr:MULTISPECIES: glycerate kinase [unclassified Fusibacter]MCK8060195.1 glycerate kinase [Fusibacter sp. A2]NPE22335.1 glycerate kinase [Fusibacter sp. A1]RXV61108.1 glycerate kinase [Fusibacter sp. A1]